ncbi:hypothetical protein B0H14DRAFT_2402635 [Mycena olivaceomarginata]|nr:hypothetical protein B0H14DRAFT_2402635 [Mycena olivaceomarginata]
MGHQLADYQLRGRELEQVCVWDFLSRVDRVSKSSDGRRHRCTADNETERDADLFDDDAEEEEAEHEGGILDSDAFKRPRVPLLKGHSQQKTHILKVRSTDNAFVPVPIGPGIPRRDKSDVYARYCRLMLIFFKPWRHAKDLRKPGQSWTDAFNLFKQNCSLSVIYKMDNMQILHECRDSRDDHFAERRYLARKAVNETRRKRGRNDIDDFLWRRCQ